LGNVAPLFLMCDPRDISELAEQRSPNTDAPTITFYDRVPDGMGLAEQLYLNSAQLLRGATELIRACPCQNGCPACVGPVGLEAPDTKSLTLNLCEKLFV
jgi:DEAD/DEAH box helicase domain-containing protein